MGCRMTAKDYFAQFPDHRFEVSKPAKPDWTNQSMVQVRMRVQHTMPAEGTKEMFDTEVAKFQQYMRQYCPFQCDRKLI